VERVKERKDEDYSWGGARGEMNLGISNETKMGAGATSKRCVTGAIATLGGPGVTAEPTAEQSGQR
jgi:hypothetical protein